MPITLASMSRRRFLGATLAGASTVLLGDRWATAAAAGQRDPDRIVLLSDIHVPKDPKAAERGVNMTQHMRQAVGQVLELEKDEARPAAAIISGDCAYHTGEIGDYLALLKVLSPLSQADLPVHLVMGNHDQRARFYATVPYEKLGHSAGKREMEGRHVLVLRSPRVDWVLLDSLDKNNASPGKLGPEQRQWLTEFLDAPGQGSKPVNIVLHHEPIPAPRPTTGPASTQPVKKADLRDATALLDIVVPRKRVKAIFYGHTHVWAVQQVEGMHLVNLPAVAYVFDAAQPSGWVDCQVNERGMRLQLHCLKASHPKQGQVVELAWRA